MILEDGRRILKSLLRDIGEWSVHGDVRELRRQGLRESSPRMHAGWTSTVHQRAVEGFFAAERPEYVFLAAAAKVGGIGGQQQGPGKLHVSRIST